jgi:hypothetical protein
MGFSARCFEEQPHAKTRRTCLIHPLPDADDGAADGCILGDDLAPYLADGARYMLSGRVSPMTAEKVAAMQIGRAARSNSARSIASAWDITALRPSSASAARRSVSASRSRRHGAERSTGSPHAGSSGIVGLIRRSGPPRLHRDRVRRFSTAIRLPVQRRHACRYRWAAYSRVRGTRPRRAL